MPDVFAPQLAIFVAGRVELALYREFVFPSVPSRTGLLPLGMDDLWSTSQEIAPLAIDIALTKAAVVIYDRGQRSRLPLEYVQALRHNDSIIVVEAPTAALDASAQDTPDPGHPMRRPSEMSGWTENFVDPLLTRIAVVGGNPPTPPQIASHLDALTGQGRYSDLLLTALALLEHQMRQDDVTSAVPTLPSEGVMTRLRSHFGPDYPVVIEGVATRHRLLQDPWPEKERDKELARVSTGLADVVRRRFDTPVPPGENRRRKRE